MVSEFIEEKDGYLALSDEQYEFEVANTDEDVNKSTRAILEIGEHREGYWNNDRFMEQMAKAVKIAETKYPSSQGYSHIWCLDHSCGHPDLGYIQFYPHNTQVSHWAFDIIFRSHQ